MKYFAFFLFVLLLAVDTKPTEAVCGYESCPETKPNFVNIHLVPHSHDDAGWLKTVDQYFYGHKNNIQHAGVQYIIDTVVSELIKDPKRRFIQVETSFFAKWWKEQSETVKQVVKKLVNEGRLEFTNGAWSMNDEAAVNYHSVIDQFTVGLKFLDETFGACARPRVGWQIDPFGHSREQASLYAQMGYDGEFFSRMDHKDKARRMEDLSLEMIWDASESLSDAKLFTGLLYSSYWETSGFCFDVLCRDDPIIDGDSYDNNVQTRVDDFLAYAAKVAAKFRTTHIMIPLGGDFQYEDAHINYKNMDKLIKYVNARQANGSHYNIFYSTPGCYLNSVHKGLQSYPNKTQDFFPYASDSNSFWTGYYTSRPTQKRFERDGNHMLQTAKQLSVFADLKSEQQKEDLDYLRQIMGIMQHHDAITGTEKQAVSNDYDRLLYDGIIGGASNARDALRVLTNLPEGEFESCLQLNISECAFTQDSADNVVVTLFNPLAHTSSQYVRVPVKEENYQVTDEKGRLVASEVVPVAWQVLALEYRQNTTQHELVFKASVNKIASYYIKKVDKVESKEIVLPKTAKKSVKQNKKNLEVPQRFKKVHSMQNVETHADDDSETVVQTSQIKLVIDNNTGRLKTVEMNGVSEAIDQNFAIYETYESGAYVFRQKEDVDLKFLEDKVEFTVYDGALVKEVHQQFSEWISQVIRIYEGVNRVEFEWLVGPIPTDEDTAREIVTVFDSEISSNGVFYTDSNGREMIKRVKDKREDFNPDLGRQPISGNYYPIVSRIALEDSNKRIALLNDRAQGGTSMQNGQLELMLHRRLVRDDGYGVSEVLNEQKYDKPLIARGKVYLILNSVEESTKVERVAEKEILLPFSVFFSKGSSQSSSAVAKTLPSFDDFPQSVHLLTLEPFTDDEILLRVENFLDHIEGNVVSFNIRPIFDGVDGVAIRETTLDGNLPLSEMKRFKFHAEGSGAVSTEAEFYTAGHKALAADSSMEASEFSVTLNPMQIRTFIIKKKK
ncbi:lysosomal alpha-mannosidase-like isoform X3 [Drosophila guanche]|uniref:lysosomal alpha-mannosidase-like isoform X2 n=1 Tax=Drosophila guanche TaxID=7266 RepID=UPI0014709702|nr:lysosomal alpha-mannosidase-like isoform X2 [Drosophila guanche]XP_034129780.1 lysosomal alpha-mannosidase-like isoform X3 [Drosophila guanche]